MHLFKEPLCPKCGQHLPLEELWDLRDYSKLRRYRLPQPLGIICPGCGIRLRLEQWPSFILFVAIIVVFLVLIETFLPGARIHYLIFREYNRRDDIAQTLGVLLEIGLLLCYMKFGPYLCRVRPTKSSDPDLEYPLSHDSWKDDYDE